MNSIFNKGREKVLECFYNNKFREVYFSEILRETKLTQNTTLKHLQNLEENKIVIPRKNLSNKFFKLNIKNPLIFSLLSYFDFKRLNNLNETRRRAIVDFLDKLPKKPIMSFVFGSTANNTYKPESDIDIYLIYSEKETKNKNIQDRLAAISGIKVQMFIVSYDYLKEQLSLKQDNLLIGAVKTCFVTTGHYNFYKEVLNEKLLGGLA